MTSKKIFKPRSSTGWVWVGALGLVLLGTGLNLIITSGFSGPFLLTILLTVPIGAGFLLIAAFFPAMRYEIEGTRLTLTYGLLLRYVIDIPQITSIRRRPQELSYGRSKPAARSTPPPQCRMARCISAAMIIGSTSPIL